MLLRAQSDLDLDLASSILIGDKLSDIEAGCAAGVGTQILLSSEHPEGEPPEDLHATCPFAGRHPFVSFFLPGMPYPKHEAQQPLIS